MKWKLNTIVPYITCPWNHFKQRSEPLGLFTWKWGTRDRWGKNITLPYMQSYNPAIPGCTFSRLLNGPAKHVNKKNAGKARVLSINALRHTYCSCCNLQGCGSLLLPLIMMQNHRQSDFLRIWCIKQPTPARRVTPPWNVYMAKFDPSWEGNPVWQTGLPALARHPTYHVNVIKLNWEIILKCRLPHLRGLPHLPGVPHRRFVKPQESKDWLFSGTLIHWHNTFLFAVFTHVRKQK